MKKHYRIIKVLCMTLALVSVLSSIAFAASPVLAIESRLNQISASSGYVPGESKPKNYCWKFVNSVSNQLFGVSIPSGPSGYMLNGGSPYWYRIGMVFDGTATDANVIGLLKQAQAGDIIQYKNKEASWQHTVMVYSTNANGITIYESTKPYSGAKHQAVRKYTCSWDTILNWSWSSGLGHFGGVYGYGLSLYRCNQNVLSGGITSGSISSASATPNVITGASEVVGQSGATLHGSFSVSGAKATECGIKLGTSPENMTVLGSDKISSSGVSMWYNTGKYNRVLTPGTLYYYRAYVIVGGKEHTGDIKSFSIPVPVEINTPAQQTPKISLNRTSLTINDTSSDRLTAATTPGGQSVSWSSSDSKVAKVSNGVVTGVKAGTATITASMRYNGTTYSAKCNVTVVASKPVDPPAPSPSDATDSNGTYPGVSQKPSESGQNNEASKPTANNVSLPVDGASSVTQTTARVDASCSYTGTRPSSVGLYLGTSSSNLSHWKSDDNINHNKNPFNIWYNLNGLSAGTTYYYQFYAIADGKTYTSDIQSFTTEAAQPYVPPVNTRSGVVVNTNGQYLAINDGPAASPNYSNQIGRIPPGGYVTVYPDKTYGNWYWVEYGSVSGYAYSRYISLQ